MRREKFIGKSTPEGTGSTQRGASKLMSVKLVSRGEELARIKDRLLSVDGSGSFRSSGFLGVTGSDFVCVGRLLGASIIIRRGAIEPVVIFLCLLSRLSCLAVSRFGCLLPLYAGRAGATFVGSRVVVLEKGRDSVSDVVVGALLKGSGCGHTLSCFVRGRPARRVITTINLGEGDHSCSVPCNILCSRLCTIFCREGLSELRRLLRTVGKVRVKG